MNEFARESCRCGGSTPFESRACSGAGRGRHPALQPKFGGAENQARILNRELHASGEVEIPFIVPNASCATSRDEKWSMECLSDASESPETSSCSCFSASAAYEDFVRSDYRRLTERNGSLVLHSMRTLDIVIVNWNTGDLLRHCLDSIQAAQKSDFELQRVVIVDNSSSDGSQTAATDDSELPLQLIENSANRGFAAAANQGAQQSRADYLLFLNPDAEISPTVIAGAISVLEERPNIGVCGVRTLDADWNVSRTCARFPRPWHFFFAAAGLDRVMPHLFPGYFMREWAHDSSRIVDHVIGAFYLVRRGLFEQLGGFDEHFFVYLEDLDFSYRAHLGGQSCFFLASESIRHIGGGSSEKIKSLRLSYALRSRVLYCRKHFSRPGAAFVLAATLFIEPITRLIALAGNRDARGIRDTARAYVLFLRSVVGPPQKL